MIVEKVLRNDVKFYKENIHCEDKFEIDFDRNDRTTTYKRELNEFEHPFSVSFLNGIRRYFGRVSEAKAEPKKFSIHHDGSFESFHLILVYNHQ